MIAFLMEIKSEKARDKLEEIYTYYHRKLFITAYSILKNYHDAEDMVQNVVLKLSGNLDKISDIKSKKTESYLVIIVRNLSYDAYKKRKGIALLIHEEVGRLSIEDDVLIEKHIINLEISKEIAEHLSKLHQPYADIIALRYYHELSISEIANALEITENNASVRINRAINALKGILEEGGVSFEQSN